MFATLRYVLAVSFVLVLGGAFVAGGYFSTIAEEVVLDLGQQKNQAIADAYTNEIWENHKEAMSVIMQIPAEDRQKYREFVQFVQDSANYLNKTKFLKMNLYSHSGGLVLSAFRNGELKVALEDKHPIEDIDSGNVHPVNVGASGDTQTEIIKGVSYRNGAREVDTDVIKTLVPIRATLDEAGKPVEKTIAVVEVIADVGDITANVGSLQYVVIGGAFGIFVVLFGILTFISIKSEKIIAKQYEANTELNMAKAKAEADNEQKSLFLASISHELRTPLNAIIGFSEIIKDEVMGEIGNEQYKNYVKDIYHSGVHLLTLINEILDYSKAEAGKLELEYEEFDLNKLVISCLRLQEPRANNGSVTLEKELPSEHITIRSDSKRLKQVMLNLMSNAVKFTPPSGKVKVSAWRNVSDNRIGIEISDTGIGIAPKDLARAFSPFGQVDNALSRKYEGTGLGLPLTKKLTELMGGEMKVESEVNQGTKIVILLPHDLKEDENKAKMPANGELPEEAKVVLHENKTEEARRIEQAQAEAEANTAIQGGDVAAVSEPQPEPQADLPQADLPQADLPAETQELPQPDLPPVDLPPVDAPEQQEQAAPMPEPDLPPADLPPADLPPTQTDSDAEGNPNQNNS